MVDLSKSMWNLALQPLKTLYLHYHNAYGHQTWHGGEFTDEPLLIKSYDPLITWSCKIAWQTRTYLHYDSVYGHQTWQDGNLSWWALAISNHMTLWSLGLRRSRDKLKPIYLDYYSSYSRQTWENGDLPWEVSTHKVIWRFDYVALQNHVTN